VRLAERPQRHAAAHRAPGGQQPDAQAGQDHVLHQFEAVHAVHDPRLEAGQRGHGADHLLVAAVP